jgi:hypothetical protein
MKPERQQRNWCKKNPLFRGLVQLPMLPQALWKIQKQHQYFAQTSM